MVHVQAFQDRDIKTIEVLRLSRFWSGDSVDYFCFFNNELGSKRSCVFLCQFNLLSDAWSSEYSRTALLPLGLRSVHSDPADRYDSYGPSRTDLFLFFRWASQLTGLDRTSACSESVSRLLTLDFDFLHNRVTTLWWSRFFLGFRFINFLFNWSSFKFRVLLTNFLVNGNSVLSERNTSCW